MPPHPTPTPNSTPIPEATATPPADAPPVFCGRPPTDPPLPLSCDAAVAAATDALPSDHPSIVSIQFGYGCPPRWRCGPHEFTPAEGFVLFYLRRPDRGLVVRVEADSQGVVTPTTTAIPWPPAMLLANEADQYAEQALRQLMDRLRERRGPTTG